MEDVDKLTNDRKTNENLANTDKSQDDGTINDDQDEKFVTQDEKDTSSVKETVVNELEEILKPIRNTLSNNDITVSIIHMVKYCLGVGVFCVHEEFMLCGVWSALVITVVLGYLVGQRTIMLARSAEFVKEYDFNYSSLAEAILEKSPWGCCRKSAKFVRFAIQFTTSFYLYLSCANITIIISRNLKCLAECVTNIDTNSSPSLNVYILALMVPCSLVSSITDLKMLAPFSMAAVCYTVVITLTTIFYGSTYRSVPLDSIVPFNSYIEIFQYIGFAMFSLDGVAVALPIQKHMAQPQKFSLVVKASMTIIVLTLVLNGFFGYWAFNETSVTPITINLPFNSVTITMKAFLCLILLVQYSISFTIANTYIWAVWKFIQTFRKTAEIWYWDRIYRMVNVFLITLAAFLISDCRALMVFMGSTCVSSLVLIYPSVLEIVVCKQHTGFGKHRWRLWKCLILIVTGVSMVVFGIYFIVMVCVTVVIKAP